MGYLFAILSSLFFTLYAIPKKIAKLKPRLYVLFMGLSCFIISVIFYLLFGADENLFNRWLIVSFIGGCIWFVASSLFFFLIDKIGVARSSEFKSLQGPIGSILILLRLSEFSSLNIYLLLLAIIFILLAALTLVINEEEKTKIKIKYIGLAILSALLYGFNGFVRKAVTLQGFIYTQQIFSSLGILAMAFFYILLKEKKINFIKNDGKKYLLASFSGLFYYFASYFMLLSYKNIEGSIAFTIIQLNSIWTCIIGIFVFKEINYKKYYKRLLLGLLFAFIGLILLIVSR